MKLDENPTRVKIYEEGEPDTFQYWVSFGQKERKYRWTIRTNIGINLILYTGITGYIKLASTCCASDIATSNKFKNFYCYECKENIEYLKSDTILANVVPQADITDEYVMLGDKMLKDFLHLNLSLFVNELECIYYSAVLETIILKILEEEYSPYLVEDLQGKDTPDGFCF